MAPAKRRRGNKKIIDPYSKKDWYLVKAPAMFKNSEVGETLVNRTHANKLAEDGLLHRKLDVILADLNDDSDQYYRKIYLQVLHTEGRTCYTDLSGMSLVRDKVCSLIRKRHTLIESDVTVKTSDGYTLRLFCIGFTRRLPNQRSQNAYAKRQQIFKVRKIMDSKMTESARGQDLYTFFKKLNPGSIGKEIQEATKKVFPLQNVYVRKVKVVRRPAMDATAIKALHNRKAIDKSKSTKKYARS